MVNAPLHVFKCQYCKMFHSACTSWTFLRRPIVFVVGFLWLLGIKLLSHMKVTMSMWLLVLKDACVISLHTEMWSIVEKRPLASTSSEPIFLDQWKTIWIPEFCSNEPWFSWEWAWLNNNSHPCCFRGRAFKMHLRWGLGWIVTRWPSVSGMAWCFADVIHGYTVIPCQTI